MSKNNIMIIVSVVLIALIIFMIFNTKKSKLEIKNDVNAKLRQEFYYDNETRTLLYKR